jgi:hypothetical protein
MVKKVKLYPRTPMSTPTKEKSLLERIEEVQIECDKFVLKRAEEVKGNSGLPIEVIVQMLRVGCPCYSAKKVMANIERDAEIAREQAEAARVSA